MDLSWDAPNSNGAVIIAYKVRFKATSTPSWSTKETDAIVTEITVNNLNPYSEYEFRVLASNANGEGAYTSSVQVRTLASLPGQVNAAQFTGQGLSATSIRFSWVLLQQGITTGGVELTSYTVAVSTCCTGDLSSERQVASTAASIEINGLNANTEYCFTVTASNSLGSGPVSALSKAYQTTANQVEEQIVFATTLDYNMTRWNTATETLVVNDIAARLNVLNTSTEVLSVRSGSVILDIKVTVTNAVAAASSVATMQQAVLAGTVSLRGIPATGVTAPVALVSTGPTTNRLSTNAFSSDGGTTVTIDLQTDSSMTFQHSSAKLMVLQWWQLWWMRQHTNSAARYLQSVPV